MEVEGQRAVDARCQTLVDMGFDRAVAERALQENGGDVNFAIAMLLTVTDHNGRLIDQSDSSLHAGGVGCDGGAADVAPPYGDASNVQLQQAIRLSKLEEDRRQKQQALRAWSAEEEHKRRQELSQSFFATCASTSASSSSSTTPSGSQLHRRACGAAAPAAGAKSCAARR